MRKTVSTIAEGQRFVMLDYVGNQLDTWQVIHMVAMPSGRLRCTVFNVDQPADMFDIYADELAAPLRFRTVDQILRSWTDPEGKIAA